MKTPRFLLLTTLITSFCLLYVYQQAEIIKLAYTGQRYQAKCQEMLERNSNLRYTIKENGSLVRIGERIAKDSDFQMPDTCRYVTFASSAMRRVTPGEVSPRQTLVSRIFGIKSQAEANTINP